MYKFIAVVLLLLPATAWGADLDSAKRLAKEAQGKAYKAQSALVKAQADLAKWQNKLPAAPAGTKPTAAQLAQAEAKLKSAINALRIAGAAHIKAEKDLQYFRKGDPTNPAPTNNDPDAINKWDEQQRKRHKELETIESETKKKFGLARTAKNQAASELANLEDKIAQHDEHEAAQRASKALKQAQQAKQAADKDLADKQKAYQEALKEATADKNKALAAAQSALNNVDEALVTENKRVLAEVDRKARNDANQWKPKYEREIQDVQDVADKTFAQQSIQNTKARWKQQVDRINHERLGNYQLKYNEKIAKAIGILEARRDALAKHSASFPDVLPMVLLLNEKSARLKPIGQATLPPLDFGPLAEAATGAAGDFVLVATKMNPAKLSKEWTCDPKAGTAMCTLNGSHVKYTWTVPQRIPASGATITLSGTANAALKGPGMNAMIAVSSNGGNFDKQGDDRIVNVNAKPGESIPGTKTVQVSPPKTGNEFTISVGGWSFGGEYTYRRTP